MGPVKKGAIPTSIKKGQFGEHIKPEGLDGHMMAGYSHMPDGSSECRNDCGIGEGAGNPYGAPDTVKGSI